MTTKTNGKGGQHNSYTFYSGGRHTHEWYNPKTGQMGAHGENCPNEIKKLGGEMASDCSNGKWLKGVK